MISVPFDALVCDMDGVLYRGNEPVPDAPQAIHRLRRAGVRLLFCTNNSHSTISEYETKLRGIGIPVDPDELLTSAVVTAEVLRERGFAGKNALVVGGPGLRDALDAIGMTVLDGEIRRDADVVAVGWDPRFDYSAMKRATAAVRRGAYFVASNSDASFPAPGELWPGAGAILASIEVASGKKADVMGKPHAPMMEAAARRLAGARRIAIVGDRADTDLAGGRSLGFTTILVTSGVTAAEDVAALDPQPDVVLRSIAELRPAQ